MSHDSNVKMEDRKMRWKYYKSQILAPMEYTKVFKHWMKFSQEIPTLRAQWEDAMEKMQQSILALFQCQMSGVHQMS